MEDEIERMRDALLEMATNAMTSAVDICKSGGMTKEETKAFMDRVKNPAIPPVVHDRMDMMFDTIWELV